MIIDDTEQFRREIARAVLDELERGRGIGPALVMLKRDRPDVYAELEVAAGEGAMRALCAADRTGDLEITEESEPPPS